MPVLLFALALAAPVERSVDLVRPREAVTCSVSVSALDENGREQSTRRVSARRAPALVFRGWLYPRLAGGPPLLFDVFNPRGQRYQVLVGEDRVSVDERGLRVRRTSRARQATLAVAGSSIAWTSMYGRWRVQPRLEGRDAPCGPPQFFTIIP